MAPTQVDFRENFCITDVVLDKYTLATLTPEYICVKFHQDEFKDDSEHAQLMLKELFPFAKTSVISALICESNVLYDETSSSKKIIELSVSCPNDCNSTYSPGDTIGIVVPNTQADVRTVLSSLNLLDKADNLCEVSVKLNTTKKNAKVPPYIPLQSSARAIIRDCLELRSVPKKLFLRSLVEYTSMPNEKTFLASVSSKEGSKLYTELILGKARTFLDILQLCPSCCPPISLLIENLPRLRPRPYSIANSPLANNCKVKFIFSVLRDKTGVATTYLSDISDKFTENPTSPTKVNIYFRESNKFIYSEDDAKLDNILIGVGCGVSPFLGFLEHKDILMNRKEIELGSTWLFVGSKCQANAVHREQLLGYQKRGVIQELYESFSRDMDCVQIQHVQDRIKENPTKFVMQLTKKDTILYVCADGNAISKSIENCIKECMVDVLKCSIEEADLIVKDSRMKGKYREDLWV